MQKKLVDKLVECSSAECGSAEECTENIEETRLVEINLIKCNSIKNKCTVYIVLFSTMFTANIGISSYFLCFYWCLKKDVTCVKFSTCTHVDNLINL